MLDGNLIGAIAATLTTICFVPQAVKIIRTRETEAISLYMYIIFTTGVCCWLVYGFYLNSMPMIIGNIITLCLSLLILFVKIKEEYFKETTLPE